VSESAGYVASNIAASSAAGAALCSFVQALPRGRGAGGGGAGRGRAARAPAGGRARGGGPGGAGGGGKLKGTCKRVEEGDSGEQEGANHDHRRARLGAAALRNVPGLGFRV
jgi:hypothetical protein